MAGLKEWFKQDWVDIGAKKWLDKVNMQTLTLKESVEVRCERKVQTGHKKHLTLKKQNKQREHNNKTLTKR